MTERDDILQRFDERFRSFKGLRISLYPGQYLDEILRLYHAEYRFCSVLDPKNLNVPADVDLVVLTDHRRTDEPDFKNLRGFCEEHGIRLFDPFGLDLLETLRDLESHKHLSLAQWKEALKDYDVVSIAVPNVAVDFVKVKAKWVLRRRFLILYNWLKSQGKTILFAWDSEEQLGPLIAEGIEVRGGAFISNEGESIFSRIAEQYHGKKTVHIGRDIPQDGIVPREYGIESRIVQYFVFEFSVPNDADDNQYCVDLKSLLDAVDQHDVVSFDVFDTLIKRVVLRPNDVFEIVEEKTGVKGFAEARFHIQTISPRLMLDEMYEWLKENCGYGEQTTETLRQTELQVESDVIFPRRAMLEVFEYAKKRNKKIALVSDMYLDAAFIDELLKNRGITGYQTLIVSNEFRKFKHEGLFDELRKIVGEGETVLHVGDNFFSDYESSQKYGLDAFYVPSGLEMAKKNGYADVFDMPTSLTERKILGLAVALGFDDPFTPNDELRIASMIVAPLSIGYLLWVVGEIKGKGYDYFLFPSRDGWLLQGFYDRLRQSFPELLPQSKYFYVNRRSAIFTIMDDFDLLKYFFYLSYKDDPPKQLRQIFNVPEEKLLPYRGESTKEYYFMHEQTLHEAAEQYRQNYRKYIEREGLEGKKCALMDFVAEGNVQKMLEANIIKMDGFYVGIPVYTSKYDENIRYFLDSELFTFHTLMKTEVYFTAPHPALDHIDDEGAPVLAKEVRPRQMIEHIEKVHEFTRRFFDVFLERLYRADERERETFNQELFFTLCEKINRYKANNFYYDDMDGQKISVEL